jgi:hypothetical protein
LALGVAVAACSAAADSDYSPALEDAGVEEGHDAATKSDVPLTPADASTTSCVPGDVSGLTPVWKRPLPFYQGACQKQSDIDLFRDACLGSSSNATACATVPQKCAQCIATPDTADRYGPLIVHHGWVELNVAGCLANAMDDPTGVECAGSVQAATACELVACAANCPVSDTSSLAAFQGCGKIAAQGSCNALEQDAKCLKALQSGDAGPVVGMCLEQGSTFNEKYDAIVKLFCGPPSSVPDAGAGGD